MIPLAETTPEFHVVLVGGEVAVIEGAVEERRDGRLDRPVGGRAFTGIDTWSAAKTPVVPPAETRAQLPAPVPAPSAAGGAAGSTAGGGGLAGFALVATLLCLVAPALLRRLRTSALIWRPVAFVSPLERPPGL